MLGFMISRRKLAAIVGDCLGEEKGFGCGIIGCLGEEKIITITWGWIGVSWEECMRVRRTWQRPISRLHFLVIAKGHLHEPSTVMPLVLPWTKLFQYPWPLFLPFLFCDPHILLVRHL